jgi:hypothetical protein
MVEVLAVAVVYDGEVVAEWIVDLAHRLLDRQGGAPAGESIYSPGDHRSDGHSRHSKFEENSTYLLAQPSNSKTWGYMRNRFLGRIRKAIRHDPELFAILTLALLLRILWIAITGYAEEDAFITFRFARNLSQGLGFTYNPGERVYGTTTPLFTLIMTPGIAIFKNPLPPAWVLDLLAALGTLYFTGRALKRSGLSRAQRFFPLFLLAISPKLWFLDTLAMETPFVLLFMALSWAAFKEERWPLAGIALGLLLWVRVDTLLWLLVLGLAILLRGWRAGLLVAGIAAMIYLPWLIFAWIYFGTPIPLTITAKYWAYNVRGTGYRINFIEPPLSMLLARIQPLIDVLRWSAPLNVRTPFHANSESLAFFSVALTGWGVLRALRRRQLLWIAVFTILEIARLSIFKLTIFNRYFVAILWPICILLGYLLGTFWDHLTGSRVRRALRYAIPGLLVVLALNEAPGAFQNFRDVQRYRYEDSLESLGLWIREHTPTDVTVQLEPLGYIGYYSERVILDEVGLVTPRVIKLKKQGITLPIPMIYILEPDIVVIHCDDAPGIGDEQSWITQRVGEDYARAARFDPLEYMEGDDVRPEYDGLARASCYDVWERR